ncbi:MAG: UDP-N-acetylmuramoylalanyl-D-glutamyl-2,6-diaminopimelate--D-alanyl-D-alanine ligase [Bosea sp.]|jgi:UDP-N-acetylmuramoyl-tripeptide--D-alanyl-D-alanine ligase|nr:UDP-N-acetylmuramoylalanyl-D-glutamyl-2,6-diaminopimelate--D-alanyl-D-alanine ligase [Bosea sp. (in: a-proteobacteria)]
MTRLQHPADAPLWTGPELVAALGASLRGSMPAVVTGASIDSRSLAPGDVFFALKDARDGHDFVPAAFAAGASLAVVDAAHAPALAVHGPLAIVDDVLRAMERAGMARRASLDPHEARVIAITGSVGKTGTKEALKLVLSSQGETMAPVASFNNHWGLPLTLVRTPRRTRYGVYEIGMSNPGEIAPLARMARPDVAVITTVQPVHLASFPSVDAIADEKAAIYEGLPAHGVAVANADIPQVARLKAHAMASRASRFVTFGEAPGADARLLSCRLHPDLSVVDADIMGQRVTYKISSPGRHIVMNSLAVLAAVKLVGADLALAALSLADLKPPHGRGARQRLNIMGGELVLMDESYNANPASMRAALENLGRLKPGSQGRRIAVLGDMLELGPAGSRMHADLAAPLAENGIDLVFACGPLMRNLYDALPSGRRGAYAAASAGLEALVLDALRAGDVITVKGSLGSKMGPLIKAMTTRFPPVAED